MEKAIGATRKDILMQLLIESVLVSGIGGLFGVILSQIGSGFVGALMDTEVTVQSS